MTLLFSRSRTISTKVGLSIGIGIMLAGLIISGARGPLVILMIGVATYLFLLKGLSKQVALIGVFAIGLLVASYTMGDQILGRYQTIADPREFFWKWYYPLKHGVRVALKNPLGEGMGYTAGVPEFVYAGSLREEFGTFIIDSGIGSAAAELGLPGLIIFLYLIIQVLYSSLHSWRQLPPGDMKSLLLAPAAFAIILAIGCVIIQFQAAPPHSSYQWFLIGVLLKSPKIASQKEESAA